MGAENAAGAGDVQRILPSADIVISSTDPEPGDSLTYDVTVKTATGTSNAQKLTVTTKTKPSRRRPFKD